VNGESINAQFKDGVLRLTLPKREEAKPKQIEVKVQ
jgi:HSP20 family molecular chaperone IbpA